MTSEKRQNKGHQKNVKRRQELTFFKILKTNQKPVAKKKKGGGGET